MNDAVMAGFEAYARSETHDGSALAVSIVSARTALVLLLALAMSFGPANAFGQAPIPPPPLPAPPPLPPGPLPLWDAQIAASFVGTSGNSDTSSFGADFSAHRRGLTWQLEGGASAVRSTTSDVKTAERYLGQVRGQRTLTAILGLSTGLKIERDQFSGLSFRSILDAGLSWALVHRPNWTFDGVTGIAWSHESRRFSPSINRPVGLLQLVSRVPFGTSGETTQRLTVYPDFSHASAYRSEAEVTAQAAMSTHLALKIGHLLRFSNDPVPGFGKTDNTTTASVVLRWRAAANAPIP
jgi:putative salt-induced outer membrane protein YdiY